MRDTDENGEGDKANYDAAAQQDGRERAGEEEATRSKSDLEQESQATAWTIRSTASSTTNHTPGHLAFGRDMIF